MKVLQINSVSGQGSTGKICEDISKLLTIKGIENWILYNEGRSNYKYAYKISSDCYRKIQAMKSRVFGNYGFTSNLATKKVLNIIKKLQPDIVHLHNLHGHTLNLKIFFKYVKESGIKIVWTFHDCWSFTGYCTYFSMIDCQKWKVECNNCPKKKRYSWFFDRSKELYNLKKRYMKDVDMTIVTPSKWLNDLVKESFLKKCNLRVIKNGIDLSIFKPTQSEILQKYNIKGKYIILGVAFGWDERKGLDVFIELSKRLSEEYQIMLVGTNEEIDKKIPCNIISIHRTQDQDELAAFYSMADVFVNPTREDNYPTTNIEAIACGTPVVTFRTGGSPECIDSTCGSVVEQGDIEGLEAEIKRVCREKPYTLEACTNFARANEKTLKYDEYIQLYKEIAQNH